MASSNTNTSPQVDIQLDRRTDIQTDEQTHSKTDIMLKTVDFFYRMLNYYSSVKISIFGI